LQVKKTVKTQGINKNIINYKYSENINNKNIFQK